MGSVYWLETIQSVASVVVNDILYPANRHNVLLGIFQEHGVVDRVLILIADAHQTVSPRCNATQNLIDELGLPKKNLRLAGFLPCTCHTDGMRWARNPRYVFCQGVRACLSSPACTGLSMRLLAFFIHTHFNVFLTTAAARFLVHMVVSGYRIGTLIISVYQPVPSGTLGVQPTPRGAFSLYYPAVRVMESVFTCTLLRLVAGILVVVG